MFGFKKRDDALEKQLDLEAKKQTEYNKKEYLFEAVHYARKSKERIEELVKVAKKDQQVLLEAT